MIFTDIDDFRMYATGVEASLSLDDLASSIKQSETLICQIITKGIYDTLLLSDENIKYAIANYAMYKYSIFWSISKNNTEQKLYKYQLEAIKEEYISSFWAAMDTILSSLDIQASYEWTSTDIYKKREKQLIKTAADFDNYFQIDKSSYFFYKIQFLLEKITEDSIMPRIKTLTEVQRNNLDKKIKRVLAYNVMADAVLYFDLSELPRSIRNDISHEFSKDGSLIQVREKLRAALLNEVDNYYKSLEKEISSNSEKTTTANYNKENDNFYFSS